MFYLDHILHALQWFSTSSVSSSLFLLGQYHLHTVYAIRKLLHNINIHTAPASSDIQSQGWQEVWPSPGTWTNTSKTSCSCLLLHRPAQIIHCYRSTWPDNHVSLFWINYCLFFHMSFWYAHSVKLYLKYAYLVRKYICIYTHIYICIYIYYIYTCKNIFKYTHTVHILCWGKSIGKNNHHNTEHKHTQSFLERKHKRHVQQVCNPDQQKSFFRCSLRKSYGQKKKNKKKKMKDSAFMKDTQIKRYTLLQVWKSKLVYVQQIQLRWSVNIYGKAFSLSLFLVNGLKVREIANLHMGKEAQIKWLCNKFTEKTSRKHRINKHYKYILNQ